MRLEVNPADIIIAVLLIVAVSAVVVAVLSVPYVVAGGLSAIWPARLLFGGLLVVVGPIRSAPCEA